MHAEATLGAAVLTTLREDGSILVDSALSLPTPSGSIPGRLAHWATVTPDAIWLSEQDRCVTFSEAETRRRLLASRLLGMRLERGRPLLLLGDNGIDHALIMMAATSIGLTVAVVQPAYAGPAAQPWAKLSRVMSQVEPALVLADSPDMVESAFDAIGVTTTVRPLRDLAWLDAVAAAPGDETDAAEATVGLDTVAKLLFTSGSTGAPKAVSNTQRMMVSNMLGLSLVWPFLAERPPRLTDWLPWSHTFGGNCCFDIALWFGGRFHVDAGRPTLALMAESVAALRTHQPSVYFNVPVGYELLLPILEGDQVFAATLLGGVDFLFNAGAAMPGALRARLEVVAMATLGRVPPIVGGWGATETAPFSTVLSFDTSYAGNLGRPMPGTTIKMVPIGGRYELRVRGPNVMPGYWRDPEATASAFDEEGFYRIGDAGRFANPADPSAGILFDGRVAENFKLASGTFVNVGALRVSAIDVGERLISDAVVTGEGRSELGLLVFPNETACRALLGDACTKMNAAMVTGHPTVAERVAELLRGHNSRQTGSSTRFVRFAILPEPPSAAHDEITDKGYINQRRVLARRAAAVEALYAAGTLL